MKTGIIVQARTGSTRLPNKMILPFYNEDSILEIILNRLKDKFFVVLATTVNQKDDSLIAIAKKTDVSFYRGSESNVLDRFIKAAEENNIETVIRICADNPFINVELLEQLLAKYDGEDYCSFKYNNGKPTILGHLGLFAEITTIQTLKKVNTLTEEKFYREHVTNYIYNHPETFVVKLHDLPAEINNYEGIRLTVDTIQDFKSTQELFKQFNGAESIDDIQNLLNEIRSNNVLLLRMQEEIENNSK